LFKEFTGLQVKEAAKIFNSSIQHYFTVIIRKFLPFTISSFVSICSICSSEGSSAGDVKQIKVVVGKFE